ncbi:MAG TPA: hypothetical protein VHZ07_23560 [Bryobacteraceae bacterium]|nr:hypothetical protein [Bryobacteraceae bacterium]
MALHPRRNSAEGAARQSLLDFLAFGFIAVQPRVIRPEPAPPAIQMYDTVTFLPNGFSLEVTDPAAPDGA